jgi:hypothetical protein
MYWLKYEYIVVVLPDCLPASGHVTSSLKRRKIVVMGFGYIFGATPVVESASLGLKLINFLEGVPIEVAHSNLEPLTLLL